MSQKIKYIDVNRIKSHWYKDIMTEWQPDKDFINYLITCLKKGKYLPAIVLVKVNDLFYIVNGHHRYYAQVKAGGEKIKSIIIEGSFEDSEPLRKAEVLLKDFDKKTDYRYQFSGYLDRWAAAVENQKFINKYRPTYKFRVFRWLKKIINRRIKRG